MASPQRSSSKVHEGDEIDVELTELPAAAFEPEDIPLDVIYEDEYLAVINKPAGMVVHPGAGVQSGTLANAIAHHFSLVTRHSSLVTRLGIVHRLDKDTSGLIVIAKTDEVHEASVRTVSRPQGRKALRRPRPRQPRPAQRPHRGADRPQQTQSPANEGRHLRPHALSLWKVRQRFDKFTLLDVEIKTGRTHQIRVHTAYINHPIVGDEIYNEGRDNTVADTNTRNAIRSLHRFFLHAERLTFTHPKTGERMEFVQELPAELNDFLSLL